MCQQPVLPVIFWHGQDDIPRPVRYFHLAFAFGLCENNEIHRVKKIIKGWCLEFVANKI